MIEVFDTTAARSALARRKLGCPDCGQALKSWGRARERTVRELGGALVTVVPDRARRPASHPGQPVRLRVGTRRGAAAARHATTGPPRARRKPGRRAFVSSGRTQWAGAFRSGRTHDQTEGIADLFT